jgi:hypothetical protein
VLTCSKMVRKANVNVPVSVPGVILSTDVRTGENWTYPVLISSGCLSANYLSTMGSLLSIRLGP